MVLHLNAKNTLSDPDSINGHRNLRSPATSTLLYRVGSHLNFQTGQNEIFRASQSSVVHIEAVLTSDQSPVWPSKLFERFIDTVVCKRCLSQSFRHHVDLLCKKSYKSSFLLGYFDCFLSDHTVGCFNISFSCLSQIRRENFCFASNVFIFLLYFFRDCSCLDATFGQLFTLRPPIFWFSPTLYTQSLLKNEFFSNVHG